MLHRAVFHTRYCSQRNVFSELCHQIENFFALIRHLNLRFTPAKAYFLRQLIHCIIALTSCTKCMSHPNALVFQSTFSHPRTFHVSLSPVWNFDFYCVNQTRNRCFFVLFYLPYVILMHVLNINQMPTCHMLSEHETSLLLKVTVKNYSINLSNAYEPSNTAKIHVYCIRDCFLFI